ncbi:MAG: hypothetical protein EOR04_19580 [Mesorhizobium sp.]|uniref:hypothetical protein n=1 Tax=Mesorhizobium sp. TaxID=1871066 RepID=UPI000FE527BA|nr:hypothetical protein [Mesorhizobium sp.]RWP40149.1 MAG: hypothetical protein EOR04_19580 [Mesorhizobium sp.]
MHSHTETPPLPGSFGRNGVADNSKAVAAQNYLNAPFDAKGFAACLVAKRFGLSPCLARLVCELAHIGGRLA